MHFIEQENVVQLGLRFPAAHLRVYRKLRHILEMII